MDPHSSFRYEHDFYIYGRDNSFFKYQLQSTNLADYSPFYRGFGGYRRRVAERLYFPGIFLAPHTGWRSFWYCLRDRVGQSVLGNVWVTKKLRPALSGFINL